MSGQDMSREASVLSRDEERRLLEAGRRVFATAYPDPERAGGFDAAVEAAVRGRLPAGLVDALTWSSETFEEYERELKAARERQEAWEARKRRALWWAAAATVVLAAGATVWWGVGFREPGGSENRPVIAEDEAAPRPAPVPAPEVAPEKVAPEPEYEVASLDLRGLSPVRGEAEAVGDDLPVVSAKPLDLTVTLPIGSEDGEYEVAVLRSPGKPLLSVEGHAGLAGGNILLRARLDLSGLAPGQYYWGMRRGEFPWSYYRIRLR